jgi:hypothetical protein
MPLSSKLKTATGPFRGRSNLPSAVSTPPHTLHVSYYFGDKQICRLIRWLHLFPGEKYYTLFAYLK